MEIQKHTLNLRKGDWDKITRIYGQKGVSTAVVIRQIISRFVDEVLPAQEDPEELKKIQGEI